MLRYVLPALLLAPQLLRHGVLPRLGDWWLLPAIVIGAGFPFGLLGMAGAQFAPAAHMGVLLSGAMPLFVAVFAAVFVGERFTRSQLCGLTVIVAGLAVTAGPALLDGWHAAGSGLWRGHLLFLAAGLLWAIYTVAYRRSGLAPWHAAAVICFWSALLVVPLWLWSDHTSLSTAPPGDLLLQLVMQGFVAGLAGLACYAVAIRNLGATVAATSGAAVPPMTALGGLLLLAEPVGLLTAFAIAVTALGITLSTGVTDPMIRWLRRRPL